MSAKQSGQARFMLPHSKDVPDSLNALHKQLPGLEFSSTWNTSNDTYAFMVHIETPKFDMIILTFMKRLKNSSLLVWV